MPADALRQRFLAPPTASTSVPSGSRWKRKAFSTCLCRSISLRGRRLDGASGAAPVRAHPSVRARGVQVYETGAITRYIDEAFAGRPLQPDSPQDRARVNQLLGILDAYAYRTLVWDIYVERVSAPKRNRPTDEARVARHCRAPRSVLPRWSGSWAAGRSSPAIG